MGSVFQINENDLLNEWREQPHLMREAGREKADAQHDAAQAKARLAVVHARLSLLVRREPEKYDLPAKPVVDAVESTVIIQPEYQQALEEYNRAEHLASLTGANVTAMVDRRKALENLVELLSLNYYTENDEPRARSSRARDQIDGENRRSIRGEGLGDGD